MERAELKKLINSLSPDKRKIVEDLVLTLTADKIAGNFEDIKPGFGGGKGIFGKMSDDFDGPLDDFKQ